MERPGLEEPLREGVATTSVRGAGVVKAGAMIASSLRRRDFEEHVEPALVREETEVREEDDVSTELDEFDSKIAEAEEDEDEEEVEEEEAEDTLERQRVGDGKSSFEIVVEVVAMEEDEDEGEWDSQF